MKIGDIVRVVSETTSLTKSANKLGKIGRVVMVDEYSVEVDFVGDGDFWDTRHLDEEDLEIL